MAYAAAGKRVLITGASSGLGAALARQLAAHGAVVGLIARRRDRLAEVLADCRRTSPDSAMWVADLADTAAVGELALRAWDALGGIDVLVNNAAIPKRRPVTAAGPGRGRGRHAGQLLRPDAADAGAAAADAGARLGHDRQRVQRRWPARHHPRNRLLCKQIRAVWLERGDGRRPARHRGLGQADRARARSTPRSGTSPAARNRSTRGPRCRPTKWPTASSRRWAATASSTTSRT